MAGYWKIQKEWINDWGLTATEALVLADIMDWPKCTHKERAARVGLSTRQLTRIEDILSSNDKTKCLIPIGQNVLPQQDKMSSKVRQNVLKSETKCPIPPYPPILEEQEEQEEHFDVDDDVKRGREGSESGIGEKKSSGSAPTPLPPAPGHGDTWHTIADLHTMLRQQYATETEVANAIRMKLNRDHRTLLAPEELAVWFDRFAETQTAGGVDGDTVTNHQLHFRNWLFKQFQLQKNNTDYGRKTERPAGIADADQFVDRL